MEGSVLQNLRASIEAVGEKATVEEIEKHFAQRVKDAEFDARQVGRAEQRGWDEMFSKVLSSLLAVVAVLFLTWATITYHYFDESQWKRRLKVCEEGYTVGCMDAVKTEMSFTFSSGDTAKEISVLKNAYTEKTGRQLPVIAEK